MQRTAPCPRHVSTNSRSSIVDSKISPAFTLIEIVTSLVVLALIVSGSLVVINNCLESSADMRLRMAAFSLARENMERLLAAGALPESIEYGDSNSVVGVTWETRVEPFYDPHTNRMWLRGVSSASWYDAAAQLKTIEFTHWLTDLSSEDTAKILRREQAQQMALDEQALAEADALLEKVLQAKEAAQTAGYSEMIALARQLIEQYPTSPAADTAREILGSLPPAVQQEYSIQPSEIRSASSGILGSSSESLPSDSMGDSRLDGSDRSTQTKRPLQDGVLQPPGEIFSGTK